MACVTAAAGLGGIQGAGVAVAARRSRRCDPPSREEMQNLVKNEDGTINQKLMRQLSSLADHNFRGESFIFLSLCLSLSLSLPLSPSLTLSLLLCLLCTKCSVLCLELTPPLLSSSPLLFPSSPLLFFSSPPLGDGEQADVEAAGVEVAWEDGDLLWCHPNMTGM